MRGTIDSGADLDAVSLPMVRWSRPKLLVAALGTASVVALGWFAITPRLGWLWIRADAEGDALPARVAIDVDGQARCDHSPCLLELKKGPHLVRVEAPGYEAEAQGMIVRAGKRTEVAVWLRPNVPESRVVGELGAFDTAGLHEEKSLQPVRARKADAKAAIASPRAPSVQPAALAHARSQDRAPSADPETERAATPADVPPEAAHAVPLPLRGDLEATAAVGPATAPEVAPAVAAPEPCALNLNTVPPSRVLVDARPLGFTPKVGVTVPAGTHRLVFVDDDGRRLSAEITCKSGEHQTVSMRFGE